MVGMTTHTNSVAIQLSDGAILRYAEGVVDTWRTAEGRELVFPQMCTQMAVTTIGGEASHKSSPPTS